MKELLLVVLIVASTTFANAATVNVFVEETVPNSSTVAVTEAFTLPLNPVPANYVLGDGFDTNTVPVSFTFPSFPGPGPTLDGFGFFNLNSFYKGGGIADNDLSFNLIGTGQMYSGPESNPTLIPGTYYGTDFVDGANGTVKITINSTPLPAAFPLFGVGLAGLGWLVRRRRG